MATKSTRLAAVAADNDPILTTEQLSELTQIAVGTLNTWRSRGKGPAWFKLSNLVRYRQSEVNRWLAQSGDTTLSEVR